jgi:hypothetical protein
MTKLFPAILFVLMLCASVAYGVKGDVRHCLYWLFVAGITYVVTW